MTDMTKDEYLFLKGLWSGFSGAAFYAVGDTCYEFGWIDDLGIVTPKGEKAIEEYENGTGDQT